MIYLHITSYYLVRELPNILFWYVRQFSMIYANTLNSNNKKHQALIEQQFIRKCKHSQE